jgi:nucleoside-diphosphate-sugar epimerase
LLRSDLLDFSSLSKEIGQLKPDVVYHLAAYVNLSRDPETASRCFDINLKGTYNLLEALVKIKVTKIIFSSTEEFTVTTTPF